MTYSLEGTISNFSPIKQAQAVVAAKKAMMPVLKVAPKPAPKKPAVPKPVAIKPVPLPKPIVASTGGGGGGGVFGGLADTVSAITAPDKLPFVIGAVVAAFFLFRRR